MTGLLYSNAIFETSRCDGCRCPFSSIDRYSGVTFRVSEAVFTLKSVVSRASFILCVFQIEFIFGTVIDNLLCVNYLFMLNQAFVHDKSNKLFVHQNMTEIKFTSFGEWLRGKIAENNLSNAELGRRVGLSPTYIGNLVRDYSPNSKTGSIRASEGVVASIAKALGVNIDEARLAAGYSPLNTLVFDEETIGLFKQKEKLSPAKQRLVNRQLKAIIEALAEEEEDFDY